MNALVNPLVNAGSLDASRAKYLQGEPARLIFEYARGVIAENVGNKSEVIESGSATLEFLGEVPDSKASLVMLTSWKDIRAAVFLMEIAPTLFTAESGWQELDDDYAYAPADMIGFSADLTPESLARPQVRRWVNDQAGRMVDGLPGGILAGAARPECYRLARDLFIRFRLNTPDVLDHVEWFNRMACFPGMARHQVDETVHAALSDVLAGERPRKIAPAPAKSSAPFKKVVIRYLPKNLPQAADAAEAAMLADIESGPLFAHGGAYATVRAARPTTASEMQTGETAVGVYHFDRDSLRERVMKSVDFYEWKGKEYVQGTPAQALTDTMISRGGGTAPTLTGLLSAPVVLPDGLAHESYGWDARTGLFQTAEPGTYPKLASYTVTKLVPSSEIPGLKPLPGDELADVVPILRPGDGDRARLDAQGAYTYLTRELLGEFPFRSPVDKAAAIAALLTGLERPVCGIAPAFLASSGVQSTGKTTLVNLISAVVHGSLPGLMTWPEGDEELSKVIFAALYGGRTVLAFDNLKNGAQVRSAALAKLLSSETHEGRLLGESRIARVPAAALVLLSGNNLTLEGDLPSRVIEIYLDAGMERPDQRTFKRSDIVAYALENRPEIVSKALTIVKAYIDSGSPAVGAKPSRFPLWDRMVRFPIIWAGGADIGEKFTVAHQDDPTLSLLRDMLQAWRPALGNAPLSAGGIAAKLETGEPFAGDIETLRRALHALIGERHHSSINTAAIGQTLKRFVNRPLDSLVLSRVFDSHAKSYLWSVQNLSDAASSIFPKGTSHA